MITETAYGFGVSLLEEAKTIKNNFKNSAESTCIFYHTGIRRAQVPALVNPFAGCATHSFSTGITIIAYLLEAPPHLMTLDIFFFQMPI